VNSVETTRCSLTDFDFKIKMGMKMCFMKMGRALFLLGLTWTLSLAIVPAAQAQDTEEYISVGDGLFVLDDNSVINYHEITSDIIQGLSEDEWERLKAKVTSDMIETHPEILQAVPVPLTDEQMQRSRLKREALINDLRFQTDQPTSLNSLNIGTNATLLTNTNLVITFYQGNSGTALTSENTNRVHAAWGSSGTGWADARAEYLCPGGVGPGYGFSIIGLQAPITGSGSRAVEGNIQGSYTVTFQERGFTSDEFNYGNAAATIDVGIYEVNSSTGAVVSSLAARNVLERGFAITFLPNAFDDDIAENFTVTLQAGKTYIFWISAYTESEMAWYELFEWTLADMYSNPDGGSGEQGVDFASVQLTWD
jgi:hypothetical protein